MIMTVVTHVVELIPGERYVVFRGTQSSETLDELIPGGEAIEELRILAYAQRNKDVLGPVSEQVIMGMAEAIAGGIGTDVLWGECQALGRYVKERRASRRKPVEQVEEAAQLTVEAMRAPDVPVTTVPSPSSLKISGTAGEGSPWKIECEADGKPIDAHVESIGAGAVVIDIRIG
ncbi:MAG TPA: hypothetical protein VN969_26020 [Streptosporangiaceae bacterium]|nr:hypothetical protein [Streptosporangiaceae bacterium]